MTKAKYKYFGLFLAFVLLGFAVVTPAAAMAPSWVGDGKYANYLGGFDISIPGLITVSFTITANWNMSSTAYPL